MKNDAEKPAGCQRAEFRLRGLCPKSDARSDWAKDAPTMRAANEVVIPEDTAARLPEGVATLVQQLLAPDLQPAYHAAEADRVYGMTVADWNIRWRAAAGQIEVVEARRVGAKIQCGS